MRKSLVFALAVSMIASGAIAAPKKSNKAVSKKAAAVKTVKSAKTKKADKVTVTSAQAATAPAPTAAPATASSGGQTTSTIAQATAEVKKSKFGMLLNNRAGLSMNAAHREGGDLGGYLLIRPSYKVSDTTSVAIGQEFDHSYGVTTLQGGNKASFTLLDTYAQVANSSLGTLPGDVKVKGYARYYIPNSEASQASGQIGQLRLNAAFKKDLGSGFAISYVNNLRPYFQQYRTFTNAKGKEVGTRSMRVTHYGQLDITISESVSFYTLAGFDHNWMNGDDNVNIRGTRNMQLLAESAIAYSAGPFTIAAGLDQLGPDMESTARAQGPLYRDDFTRYFLDGTLAF